MGKVRRDKECMGIGLKGKIKVTGWLTGAGLDLGWFRALLPKYYPGTSSVDIPGTP